MPPYGDCLDPDRRTTAGRQPRSLIRISDVSHFGVVAGYGRNRTSHGVRRASLWAPAPGLAVARSGGSAYVSVNGRIATPYRANSRPERYSVPNGAAQGL